MRFWRVLLLLGALNGGWLAEEGMWTFDNPPSRQIQEKYGFALTEEWLEHLRLSSVRFNDGGSGSFVSPQGLVLTNHHVGLGQLQKLSTPEKNYARDGFLARSLEEELKCPDLELNVLVSLEDVTSRVEAALAGKEDPQAALEARRAVLAAIEKESLDATGLRSEVVPLYQGGEYWLYRYRRYTDIRLVFAPEQQAAYFGGDPDNFTYPRYCLDFAFFRVYENDRPIHSPHYLKWNPRGAGEGELVFVSGNPGTTNRLYPMERLLTLRDHLYPLVLEFLQRRLQVLRDYSSRGPEEARQASGQILSLENALKAYSGQLRGLQEEALLEKKRKEEEEFRARVASRPELRRYQEAWEETARAEAEYRKELRPWFYRRLPTGSLASTALTLVQYVAEVEKPDAERLDGFHEAELESLKFRLFSPAPVYLALEEVLLADALQESLEKLGPEDPFVKAALQGHSPAQVAREVLSGTGLADPQVRREYVEGGKEKVAASQDPLLALARRLDPVMREMQKWYEQRVRSVREAAGEKIGRARFEVYGKSAYPDATFTLRLAYGAVRGYPMNGTRAPYKTTFYGLYNRAYGFDLQPPFQLVDRYRSGREKLDLSAPLNFVSTVDITGGNSGSPVVNREGELVGLIFDGNIESLVGSFVYDEETSRAVSVHSGAIVEVLRKLYLADSLLAEILH